MQMLYRRTQDQECIQSDKVEKLPESLPGFRFPAKHVLVAGTTVLQAVDDDTWAMATHTGIHTQILSDLL
eukprot:g15546.t1